MSDELNVVFSSAINSLDMFQSDKKWLMEYFPF